MMDFVVLLLGGFALGLAIVVDNYEARLIINTVRNKSKMNGYWFVRND